MIILMGVAGAGKSSQGQLFAGELGYQWISTGEIFRSQLSDERQKELQTGKLLGDREVIELVDHTLGALKGEEAVLDGFPRTISQAEWLMKQVKDKRFNLEAVFNLVATREVVKARLLARGRSDDSEEGINERFSEYENKTVPIIEFFRNSNISVYDINADQPPEAVHSEMMSHISK
ncbi:MAG TPA: nucleoside monophosphate kinase [Candidatus Saccharimonadales bacterium]|jgi:adenylate kinase